MLFSDPGNIGGALIICFYLWNQRNVVECFLGYYRRYVHTAFQIVDVVARWPGATHDARIFRESALCTHLEQGILDLLFPFFFNVSQYI